MWARWRSCAPEMTSGVGVGPHERVAWSGAEGPRDRSKDATNKEPELVYPSDEVDGARGRSTAYIHDRGDRRYRVGADRTHFSLQQHVAAHHQYGHHNRDISDGVLDSSHAEPRWRGDAGQAR